MKNTINGESGYVINDTEESTPPQAAGSNLIEPKSCTLSPLDFTPNVSEQADSTSSKLSTLNGESTVLNQLTTGQRNSIVSTDRCRKALEGPAEDSRLTSGDFLEGLFLAFPEMGLLVNELELRLKALENVLSTTESVDVAQDSNTTRKVEMTTDQFDAINGISTNVWGILNCLNDHRNHFKSQRKFHRGPEGGSNSRQFRRNSSLDLSPRSTKDLIDAAINSSTKSLLHNMLEPEKPQWRHHTVFSSNNGMNFTGIGSASKIPKELLLRMIYLEPTAAGRSSVAYIAQTYGGVQLPSDFENGLKNLPSFKSVARQVGRARSFVRELQRNVSERTITGAEYIPIEFKRLGLDERKQLAQMLSWENIKVWGFNAFQLDTLSSVRGISYDEVGAIEDADLNSFEKFERTKPGCPIVLMGWALLASPYAQLAMAQDVNDAELIRKAENAIKKKTRSKDYPLAHTVFEKFSEGTRKNEADELSTDEEEGYFFLDKFGITPHAICYFLRKVEKDYPSRDANPYHNNIHAADVLQTTHALMQMGGADLFCAFSCLEIFTILIAAALHDVQHPGTNNNYQINKQTDLAMVYNDHSVLENMHASRASYLLRESGGTAKSEDNNEGIFGNLSEEDRIQLRAGVIRSILSTDMSQHFKAVAKMKMYIDEAMDDIENESSGSSSVLSVIWKSEHSKLREKLLPFILHLADISNPTKSPDVSIEWSHSAYDEFFLQGDKEASEGMPISPLCDRSTTNPADGQVGFITFVVKPAFLVLQQCLPGIDVVLTQLDENLMYWEVMKDTVKNDVGNQEME